MDNTKILAISGVVIIIPIIAVTSFNITTFNHATTITTNSDLQYRKELQCHNGMKIKMFDNEVIPKYIVGKGYKIIYVNPATTDVIVNKCTLQTNIIHSG